MGWKWNDKAALMRETGLFTEEQITAAGEIDTAKKWELVEILEARIVEEGTPVHGVNKPQAWFEKGRISAFREVIEGVKPHDA